MPFLQLHTIIPLMIYITVCMDSTLVLLTYKTQQQLIFTFSICLYHIFYILDAIFDKRKSVFCVDIDPTELLQHFDERNIVTMYHNNKTGPDPDATGEYRCIYNANRIISSQYTTSIHYIEIIFSFKEEGILIYSMYPTYPDLDHPYRAYSCYCIREHAHPNQPV